MCRLRVCGWPLMVGGGMMTFHEQDDIPAPCPKCKAVVLVNRLAGEPALCPVCGGEVTPYSGPVNPSELSSGVEAEALQECQCPACGKNELSFAEVGCWD